MITAGFLGVAAGIGLLVIIALVVLAVLLTVWAFHKIGNLF